MYTVINVLVHLVTIGLFAYAFFTEPEGSREKDMTMQKFAGFAGLALLCSWAFLIGETHNIKSLIALIW